MKLNEASKRYYGVKCSGGSRPKADISLIVVHQTASGFNAAAGVAGYLHNRPDGSVEEVVDDHSTYVLAPATQIVCGDAGYNTHTYHIESSGPAPGSASAWLKHTATLNRAAWSVARQLRLRDLPCEYRTTADLNAGRVHGWTEHKELSLSKLASSTHTDEMPGAADRKLKALVAFWYKAFRLHVPKRVYV